MKPEQKFQQVRHFEDGMIVVGPFVQASGIMPNDPLCTEDDNDDYGMGFGVVDHRYRNPVTGKSVDKRYVPIRIMSGDRMDGGYSPASLTIITNAAEQS